MQSLTISQMLEAGLMWIVALCFFTAMFLASRQKQHLDPARLSDEADLKRFERNPNYPPVDMLTAHGRLWRKRINVLWGIGSAAFLILIIRSL